MFLDTVVSQQQSAAGHDQPITNCSSAKRVARDQIKSRNLHTEPRRQRGQREREDQAVIKTIGKEEIHERG